jgi:quercetin dioxygenase-like cupin family protein
MRFLLLLLLICWPSFPQRQVAVDNDSVRVLVVTSEPGPKGRMHDHKMNRVMLYLDEGSQRLEYQDGKKEDLRFRAGQALWSPAGGMHTSQNTAAKPWRVVEIELKKPPKSSKSPWTDLDPVKVDPRHYKVELENEQVRIIRFRNEAHGKIALHQHAVDRVVVFLTPVNMKVTSPDGKVSELRKQAGEVAFSGPATHREENAAADPIELVAVELK